MGYDWAKKLNYQNKYAAHYLVINGMHSVFNKLYDVFYRFVLSYVEPEIQK